MCFNLFGRKGSTRTTHVYSQKTKVQHACWWKEHSRDHYMWDVLGSNKPCQLSLQTYLISHFLHCLQWQHDWIIFNPNKLDLTHQLGDVYKTMPVMNQQETSQVSSSHFNYSIEFHQGQSFPSNQVEGISSNSLHDSS